MFNKIKAIIIKDTRVRFSSRSELLFFLILPVIFTFILGGGGAMGGGDSRVRLPVVDLDQSGQSAAFLEALSQSVTVRPDLMTEAEATQLLADRNVEAILIIPAGFERTLSGGEGARLSLSSAPNSNTGLVAEQAVGESVAAFTQPIAAARLGAAIVNSASPFADEAALERFVQDSRSAAAASLTESPARLSFTSAASAGVDYDPNAQASAGQLLTWVLIPLIGISALFADERVAGTLRRTVVTPTSRAVYLLGTISGQLLMALVQMLILAGFGILIMNVPWGRDPAALVLVLVTFGLAGVALGTMLGTIIRSPSQANNLSIMLGMSMALLGGCWFPLELFPPAVRSAVQVLPTTWAMQAMNDITLRGQGIAGVLPEAAVLLGFAVVFFVVGVWRFRYE